MMLAVRLLTLCFLGGPDDGNLERALSAVRPAAIEADLAFLTDPELGGRGTGSDELEAAALFVVSRVRHLGLAPGSTEGYRPRFPLVRASIDRTRSSLTLSGVADLGPLELGGDVFLRGNGDRVEVDASGPIVGAGDGSDEALEAAGELTGTWALIADSGRRTPTKVRHAIAAVKTIQLNAAKELPRSGLSSTISSEISHASKPRKSALLQ